MSWTDLEDLNENSLRKALELVYKYTGISMSVNKRSLLQGRLRSRIKTLGFHSYDQYLEYLDTNKTEVQSFIDEVTTNETYFFRTARVWDYFNNVFLNEWYSANSDKTLKIWSGASSTGEEIYSIAICCEEFRSKNPGFNYHITGTDISSEVLKHAEAGEYSGRSIDLLKSSQPLLLEKYLIKKDEIYSYRPELKKNILFSYHNLFTLPSQTNVFDIMFLRNVLIYFNEKDQERVLNNVSKAVKLDGTLIIGESESLGALKTPFQFEQPLIYKKKRSHQ